jgi:hypothetical protein
MAEVVQISFFSKNKLPPFDMLKFAKTNKNVLQNIVIVMTHRFMVMTRKLDNSHHKGNPLPCHDLNSMPSVSQNQCNADCLLHMHCAYTLQGQTVNPFQSVLFPTSFLLAAKDEHCKNTHVSHLTTHKVATVISILKLEDLLRVRQLQKYPLLHNSLLEHASAVTNMWSAMKLYRQSARPRVEAKTFERILTIGIHNQATST